MEPFVVSAPGKVIIFGEHLAVYSKPAIAAALDLRCYLLVTPLADPDVIRLEFADIALVHQWPKHKLPWDKIAEFVEKDDQGRPKPTKELVPEIQAILSQMLGDMDLNLHFIACHCFLYMYCQLANQDLPGLTFQIRSTLPIGAGLGSLALTAVCLALAIAVLGGHVNKAHMTATEKVVLEGEEAEYINDWSFVGEMCFHGNPSGIDNAVATFGGAVMFQRKTNEPSVRTAMRNFPPLKLLLTNTKVPRLTAELVAGVGRIHATYPKTALLVLDAMDSLATEAYHIMIQPFVGAEDRKVLRELVNINHGLLVALGVSHPSLEQIKMISDTHKIGATKLTGAGGGGCAITLVNDDTDEDTIGKVMKEFELHGFETFETLLGGKGVGCLAYSDVDESDRARVFSSENFSGYKTREQVQQGVGNQANWKYW